MFYSIIIPVYNVENYLRECINSIINQYNNNMEVILVDDGSTDGSGIICDEYAEKYSFIRVIHQENGGLSAARNTGIINAKGEYLLFVDSDDYIGENTLDVIQKKVESSTKTIDLMFLETIKFYEDGSELSLSNGFLGDKINNRPKAEVIRFLSTLPKYPGPAWAKLLRRSLIIDNNLLFKQGIIAEDIEWSVRLFKLVDNFAYLDVKYYYYRQGRKGSITNSIALYKLEDLLDTIEKNINKDLSLLYQREINSFMAYELMIAIYNYGRLSQEDKNAVIDRLKNDKWVLKFGKAKKTRIVCWMVRILGLNITGKILARNR